MCCLKRQPSKGAHALDCSSSLECQYMCWMLHNTEFLGQFTFFVKNLKELIAAFAVWCSTAPHTINVLVNFKCNTCLSLLEHLWIFFSLSHFNSFDIWVEYFLLFFFLTLVNKTALALCNLPFVHSTQWLSQSTAMHTHLQTHAHNVFMPVFFKISVRIMVGYFCDRKHRCHMY